MGAAWTQGCPRTLMPARNNIRICSLINSRGSQLPSSSLRGSVGDRVACVCLRAHSDWLVCAWHCVRACSCVCVGLGPRASTGCSMADIGSRCESDLSAGASPAGPGSGARGPGHRNIKSPPGRPLPAFRVPAPRQAPAPPPPRPGPFVLPIPRLSCPRPPPAVSPLAGESTIFLPAARVPAPARAVLTPPPVSLVFAPRLRYPRPFCVTCPHPPPCADATPSTPPVCLAARKDSEAGIGSDEESVAFPKRLVAFGPRVTQPEGRAQGQRGRVRAPEPGHPCPVVTDSRCSSVTQHLSSVRGAAGGPVLLHQPQGCGQGCATASTRRSTAQVLPQCYSCLAAHKDSEAGSALFSTSLLLPACAPACATAPSISPRTAPRLCHSAQRRPAAGVLPRGAGAVRRWSCTRARRGTWAAEVTHTLPFPPSFSHTHTPRRSRTRSRTPNHHPSRYPSHSPSRTAG